MSALPPCYSLEDDFGVAFCDLQESQNSSTRLVYPLFPAFHRRGAHIEGIGKNRLRKPHQLSEPGYLASAIFGRWRCLRSASSHCADRCSRLFSGLIGYCFTECFDDGRPARSQSSVSSSLWSSLSFSCSSSPRSWNCPGRADCYSSLSLATIALITFFSAFVMFSRAFFGKTQSRYTVSTASRYR